MCKNLDKTLISIGSLLIVIGIGISPYTAIQNEPASHTFWSSIIILGGTFFLGCGFYLKCSLNPKQKLSEYGHFMLGLSALITLPQAPEMLKHLLQIETAVTYLQNIFEDREGEAKSRSSAPIRTANTPTEIEEAIRGLVRTENAYEGSGMGLKSALREPKIALSPSMPHKTPNQIGAPTPGMAYLTPEKADKIIATLGSTGFDKNTAEALVQENLEVWHPMNRASKHNK